DRDDFLRWGPADDLRALHVGGRSACLVAGHSDQWLFHAWPIFVDGGVAAGIVSDAHARHRHGVCVQCSAIHRLPWTAIRRSADRSVRWFSKMAVAFSFIYILGFIVVPLLPETKGKPLPA